MGARGIGRLAAAVAAAALCVAVACSSGTTPSAPAATGANAPGKFVWHDLTTPDPAAAKTFYTALFGWEYTETTALGRAYTVARLGGKPVAGIHAPNPERGKTVAHWL